jgi:O-antigen/teichoic acid export membrane protein
MTLLIAVAFTSRYAVDSHPGGAAICPTRRSRRIMIWSIPIGFVNSVTQYVLIAVNQQRYLTKAFLIAVAFTTITNLLLVPRFGYIAAAALLIPAEISLFIPFSYAVHRHVGPMPWFKLLGRPALAAAGNLAVTWGLTQAGMPLFVSLPAGAAVYTLALFLLGAFRGDEFIALRGALLRAR